jgi:DNA-binding response OmpR family regulator
MKYKLLIIEDEKAIREELVLTLQNSGYEVCSIDDFSSKIAELAAELSPHLILLDVNLPGTGGFDLCRQIRASSNVPIIFVTSRNTHMDELKSITLGGDDFITKPYNIPVLLARINSLLRRAYPQENEASILTCKDAKLDIEQSKISYRGVSEELTKNELKILTYLFRNSGKINARADIIEYLWDNRIFVDDNTLSVNMTRIRAKLKKLGLHDFIQTKHRQGYLI